MADGRYKTLLFLPPDDCHHALKNVKFAIDIGHNAPSFDTGAVGVEREDVLTAEVGKRLITILRSAGHVVIETCPNRSTSLGQSLRYRVQHANSSLCDIFISIHFNAFNKRAYGSEVFAISRSGAAIGKSILDEIIKLGFYNRGVKRAPFYVLKHTRMPAVLVECCFCDSAKDMQMYEPNAMARAIATGLIGELPDNDCGLHTLRVSIDTWLKQSTEQAADLSDSEKKWITKGKYQVLSVFPSEEQHYFVKLADDSEWFVYNGHAEIS